MNTYSNLTEKIVLSKSGLRVHSKSNFKGYYDPKTHSCSCSDTIHRVQKTDVYVNSHGDYLFSARDMGWNHPFWTKMRADILADAVSRLLQKWEKFEIPFNIESHFIMSLIEEGTNFIVIRNHTEAGLKSVIFTATSSSTENRVDIDSAIRDTLVFTPYIGGKTVERLGFSHAIEYQLKLTRIEALVQMAQHSIPHILCEGLPDDADYIHRLSSYLQADNMLINGDSPQYKINLIRKLALASEDDLLEIAKLMLNNMVNLSEWEMSFSYRGLPKMQTDRLISDKAYAIAEQKLWAKAVRIGEPSVWNTELGFPSGEERCPEMNWLGEQKNRLK
jgi:hypothetical protein